MKALTALVALPGFFLLGSCSFPHYKSFVAVAPKPLANGPIKLTAQGLSRGAYFTNYYLSVIVENTGSETAVFDSSDLSLIDQDGFTYFSASKDKENVRFLRGQIARQTLEPGQKIQGNITIVTPYEKAKGDKLTVKYGSDLIEFKGVWP
jgi:hypothetical protein